MTLDVYNVTNISSAILMYSINVFLAIRLLFAELLIVLFDYPKLTNVSKLSGCVKFALTNMT